MNASDRGTPHIIIMYVLIALLAALLVYTGLRVLSLGDSGTQGEWQCNSAQCVEFVDPQEWITENCAQSLLPNGTSYLACRVVLDGAETTIPLDVINLTFVGQQCAVAQCVQEIRIRNVNYTLPTGQ